MAAASGVAGFDASRSGCHQEEELDGCAGGSIGILWLKLPNFR